MVFLLEWSTPPTRRLLLHHSVSSFVGSCLSDFWITFPMKVSFRLATFPCVVVNPSILMMLWCRKTSSLFRSDIRRAQLSHPHSRIFMVMARKINYFMRRSTDVSFQKWFDATIGKELEASLLSTSYSLQRLYNTNLPLYLKLFVNVTNLSETVMMLVLFEASQCGFPVVTSMNQESFSDMVDYANITLTILIIIFNYIRD